MGTHADVIAAFSEEQTARLTGVSRAQLRYWDRTDFYKPSYTEENRRLAFSRIYSFKDIVALRVLDFLRNRHRVSLPHLRQVSMRLSHLEADPNRWIMVTLYVWDKKVVWLEPGTDIPQEVLTKQYMVSTVSLQEVVSDTKRDIKNHSKSRDKSKHGRVERRRFVNHNQPVIAGTRIPVSAIKRFSQAGYSDKGILLEYPDLTLADIKAALDYGSTTSVA